MAALQKDKSQLADGKGNALIGDQQVHIADANVAYTTGDLDIEAEVIAAFNTTNGKINSILAVLEAHGLVANA